VQSPVRNEARFYETTAWDNVTCRLCPHYCSIAPSRTGICGVRSNRGGKLIVDSWGKTTAVDHVYAEDLPLFHFKPHLNWVRLAGRGCTMRCPFCDQWKYSQAGGVRLSRLLPEETLQICGESGAGGVSFGLNEPAPMQEFVQDVFALARESGLETHLATSAMWSSDPLREMAALTSAFTIGLKSMDPGFCQVDLGCDLTTILGNIEMLVAIGAHVEVTWLPIPGVSDTAEQSAALLDFLSTLSTPPPLILLPYQPANNWADKGRATGRGDLKRVMACMAGYRGFVYIADPDSADMNTRCRKCGRTLVRRGMARMVVTSEIQGGERQCCPQCGTPVPYVV
jgi:pyruvate formate lyase activating enzyme